jgi:hypothetical protein
MAMCPNETTKAEIWKLREEQREAGKRKSFPGISRITRIMEKLKHSAPNVKALCFHSGSGKAIIISQVTFPRS